MPRPRPFARPDGLKGKEIGLYYKSLRMNSEKNKNKHMINLTIPPSIVSSLYTNLESIDNLAKELNIQIPPIKKLCLIDTPRNADFIPLKSDKTSYQINNRYSKTSESDSEDDVIFIETNTSQHDEIIILDPEIEFETNATGGKNTNLTASKEIKDKNLDSTQYDITNDGVIILDQDIKLESDSTDVKDINLECSKEIKNEKFDLNNIKYDTSSPIKKEKRTTADLLNSSGSDSDIRPVKKEKTETIDEKFDIQNILDRGACTSKPTNFISNRLPTDSSSLSKAGDYKYGYQDIITGTFDEKLNECLAKGGGINVKTKDSYDLSVAMYEEYKDTLSRDNTQRLLVFRKRLPTYQKSKELLDAIKANQVVVISGETGCGKSTQVPQIILDDAINNFEGSNVKILVTQPRRIAASSLAMRVACERDEPLGNSVGYAVRLEKIDPRPQGSIFFCTTGILLAELEINQGLLNYSHVILDEVHERDTDIDFSMCMLKKVLSKRSDLKLILMSATIDANKLSEYFNNCAMMEIEGLAYPVQDIYLEDILQITKYQFPSDSKGNNTMRRGHSYKHKTMQAEVMEKKIKYHADIGPWLESIKHNLSREVYTKLQDSKTEDLNHELIYEVVKHICKGGPGAILVFLPGINDIKKLLSMLTANSAVFPKSRYEIYPLHSKLPSLEQHKVFQRPPEHIRKIIIATNIAETSITIDDIVYVVNSGKIKYSGLNIDENVSTLKTEWISQANLRQRRGRAGRCQPGICYHLVTSHRASKLEEVLLPEMQRSNLLEPVLAIKRLRLGKVEDAFKLVPAAPAEATVRSAVRHLQQCGALDEHETLTPLGWHLARLPVHPAAGKLLLLGALFGCLDRAASVAAVWGFKEPFQLVIGKEKQVNAAKRRLALGEPSDHVVISEAIIQWELNNSYHHRRDFAYENFLSMNTVELLSEMKIQLAGNLQQMGFLSSGNLKSPWENRNAYNLCLFRAIVAASLYPNVGTVKWINVNRSNAKKPMRIKVRTPEDKNVSLHPSSVLSSGFNSAYGPLCNNPGANWLVYWLKQRSTDLYLIDVTLVYTLPLLFFGELKVTQAEEPDNCLISISTINVCCKKETTQLLYELRSRLDSVLASKIMGSHDKTSKHNKYEDEVLNAVIKLISAEDQGAEYLNDDDDVSDFDHYESKRWNK